MGKENNTVKYDRKTAKNIIISMIKEKVTGDSELTINDMEYKVDSLLYNMDMADISCEQEIKDINAENESLKKQLEDANLRVENAVGMLKRDKGIINQRGIIIEFLMERLGAT